MGYSGAQRLARVLKVLVTATFICNLIALPLVPGVVSTGGLVLAAPPPEGGFFQVCWQAIFRVWHAEYTAVLTLFLLFCGCCTAVILWQGRRVLDTILRQDSFSLENAGNLTRTAVCAFLIAGAAFFRAVWGFAYAGLPLFFSYNGLFIPVFGMAGLLCLVMSALFRQAAELKAENDLTI